MGRGFAVVADEVRTLAGNSQSSSNEIDNLVKTTVSKIEELAQLIQKIDGQQKVKSLGSVAKALAFSLSHVAKREATNVLETILNTNTGLLKIGFKIGVVDVIKRFVCIKLCIINSVLGVY